MKEVPGNYMVGVTLLSVVGRFSIKYVGRASKQG